MESVANGGNPAPGGAQKPLSMKEHLPRWNPPFAFLAAIRRLLARHLGLSGSVFLMKGNPLGERQFVARSFTIKQAAPLAQRPAAMANGCGSSDRFLRVERTSARCSPRTLSERSGSGTIPLVATEKTGNPVAIEHVCRCAPTENWPARTALAHGIAPIRASSR